MKRIEIPVLVVGGGPVGMLGGVLLAQQGLPCRVVERRAGVQRAPAAHVVNARSFEICRQAGIDMAALAAAWKNPADAGRTIWVTRLNGETVASLPFERQDDACLQLTPTPLRNLSQHRFEPILFEALKKTRDVDLHYGHQWEAAKSDASGVTSTIRDLHRDDVYEVRSRYLLAADGAGSRVRKSVGIEMDGPPKIQSFLMIHFEANLRTLVRERPGVLYWILDPTAGGTLVAHDIDREWVYMHGFDSDTESEADYTESRCRALVEGALGTDEHPFEIRHVGSWTMSAQVAQRFRDGRIFLAGDAAHRFPPTGGLGLNSGIGDVHGLAWKLGAVARGHAPDSLLESYEAERRPVAQNNADQSLRNAMKLIGVPQALGVLEEATRERMQATLDDPDGRAKVEAAIADQAEHFDMLGLQLGYVYEAGAIVPDGTPPPEVSNPVREFVPTSRPGARLPHAWLERDGERLSSLDLVAPQGFTLFVGDAGEAWRAAARDIGPVPVTVIWIGAGDVRDPDGHWARVAGIGPSGALLVRPDQHVAWRMPAGGRDPASALSSAVERILAGGEAA